MTFETEEELDEKCIKNIGGTVLIAKELDVDDSSGLPAGKAGKSKKGTLKEVIPPLLHKELKSVKKKAVFSFRCFGVPRSDIRSLYKECKQFLKAKSMPSRYIGNERHPAKPGTLLLRGIPGPNSCEVIVLRDPQSKKKKIWIGKTCAVQDIEAYTELDVGKPFRDTATGLLPPKLAQIMINFSQLTLGGGAINRSKAAAEPRKPLGSFATGLWEKMTVWDPFCGSGVIVLEGLIRRSHVLASDKSERVIKGCQKNIKWIRNKEKTPKAITSHAWKQNATKKCELPRRPTVIVTETSLGPALKKAPTKREVSTLVKEAETLELGFFENLAENFPDVPVVCTFPVYITRDGEKHFLPKVLPKIEKLGYRLTCVHNKNVRVTDRSSLLYLRPDQHVGREILCFLPPQKS